LWLFSWVGAIGTGESHTFSEIFEDFFSRSRYRRSAAMSIAHPQDIGGR
jgi:hypothetical protein